jgi:hypothetical protein
MANWERIADTLAEELRNYHEDDPCNHSVGIYTCSVADALLSYKQAKRRDYIVDVDDLLLKKDGPHIYTAKASHLGWPSGFWPLAIRLAFCDLKNQVPRIRGGRLESMEYNDGFTKVRITND